MPGVASATKRTTSGDTVVSTAIDETVPSTSAYLSQMINASATQDLANRHQDSNIFERDHWKTGKLTSKRLDKFAQIVLPSNVQIQLAQPFAVFVLSRNENLEKASRRARQLQMLRKQYATVDFTPLQGFQSDWEATTTIRNDWKIMTSACLLHFNGDVATMVRWIGGPHVNAHLDVPSILAKLKLIVDADIHADISRILLIGAPAECKASATEENFKPS
ncbi:hypothetical protein MHU86_3490 [Fragilaria crotonensis]|nr:hypothetical protein MHU86_3490 [Fragilaria crotonensis]